MRSLTKILLGAWVLLWAATPAGAESGWFLLLPPNTRISNSYVFDDGAPLSLWKRGGTYVTERLCQMAHAGRIATFEKLMDGWKIKPEYERAQPGMEKEVYDSITESVEWERAAQCISSDDPRLVATPTPKPPRVAAAKPPGLTYTPVEEPVGIIRYTPGRPIVVTVKLNGRSSARLVLDTGADFSVVKSELLAAAGVDLARPVARGKVIGVAGETGASYFHVVFETVGHRVQMPHVAALNTYDDDFADGLLGRDFLDRFKVVMDPAAGTITLVPR